MVLKGPASPGFGDQKMVSQTWTSCSPSVSFSAAMDDEWGRVPAHHQTVANARDEGTISCRTAQSYRTQVRDYLTATACPNLTARTIIEQSVHHLEGEGPNNPDLMLWAGSGCPSARILCRPGLGHTIGRRDGNDLSQPSTPCRHQRSESVLKVYRNTRIMILDF